MKIQFLNGGLANQTFQYIFARYYELSHPGEVMYLDDSYFAIHTVHNGYELEKVFGLHPHMLSECFDEAVWQHILAEKQKGKSVPQIFIENQIMIQMISEVGEGSQQFNPFNGRRYNIPVHEYLPQILDAAGNIYYHGYWLNKSWFEAYKEIFLEELQFPEVTDEKNIQYMEEITEDLSLSVHIRRGDYVSLNWALSTEFYRVCIENFKKMYGRDWHLFVFSDDIPWCKEHAEELRFASFRKITFVEGNIRGGNYQDLQLMSRCKGMILSNSAFCYLAALLNTEKKVFLNLTERWLL